MTKRLHRRGASSLATYSKSSVEASHCSDLPLSFEFPLADLHTGFTTRKNAEYGYTASEAKTCGLNASAPTAFWTGQAR
jgi:hypothetical protein